MEAQAQAKVQEQHTRILREDLLKKLTNNRTLHGEHFKEALAGWRVAYAKKLDAHAQEFKVIAEKVRSDDTTKEEASSYVDLPSMPEDHTTEYDRIIARMEMSQDKEIFITHKDFDRYVLDQWSWKGKHDEDFANYSAVAGR
jgi:hypothetical protein